MELIYTAAQAQFRAEVRDWLNTHIPHFSAAVV